MSGLVNLLKQLAAVPLSLLYGGTGATTYAGARSNLGVDAPSPKNRLLNGAFLVDQRNGGAAVTLSASTAYTVDRWFGWTGASPSGQTAQRVAVMSGGVAYALRLARASGSTAAAAMSLGQVCESLSNIDMQGQAVTLSFKARAGANFSGSGLAVTVATGTGTDQGAAAFAAGTGTGGWTGYAVAANGTQALTTSWATYVLQATIPAGATQVGVSFGCTPTGTAGAADNADVTDVQLEIGTFAAAQVTFERRSYGQELALCQRFYQPLPVGFRGTPSTANPIAQNYAFPPMRVAPSYIASGNPSFGNIASESPGVNSAYSFLYSISPSASNTDTYSFNRVYLLSAELT